ncbi:MAG: hypothetical protein JSW53_00580 [Candidatus Bathyarchaeota archaeon]|nr:MAG: hypothetical protein JSW53_00580 [Candidatus Bathyarchaeota archaeon]
MPVSRVFITRFFQLVKERRFAEAERMLERSRKRARKNEWNRGYFEALLGILLAQKSSVDRYLFLPQVDPSDEQELKNYRRDFQEHTRNAIHADYDRGFFSAWTDYMGVLLKLSHGKKREKRESVREKQPVQAISSVQIKPRTTVQTRL